MSYRSLEEAILYGWEFERSYVCSAHDDHSASASVNAVTGAFFCYACGHKGKIDPEKMEITDEGFHRLVQRVTAEERPKYPESWLNAFDSTGPGEYWLSRYSAETCGFYRLGQAPGIGTYPMRDNQGNVLGVVSRDLTGEREQKYLYPYGVSVSRYLIDIHRVTSDVLILVEGMSDVAAVYDAGFHCAVGCYRNGLSGYQAKLLMKYDPAMVYVAFDQDKAGNAGWTRIWQDWRADLPVRRLWWSDYKDLAAIPLSERREMLSEVVGNGSITVPARVDSVTNVGRVETCQ